MSKTRWRADFDELLSLLVPIAATIYLLFNLQPIWNLPTLRGSLGLLDIILVLVVTVANVILYRLLNLGFNLAFMLLILLNLIALAIWYKYFDFRVWTGMNLSPLAFSWMLFSR